MVGTLDDVVGVPDPRKGFVRLKIIGRFSQLPKVYLRKVKDRTGTVQQLVAEGYNGTLAEEPEGAANVLKVSITVA